MGIEIRTCEHVFTYGGVKYEIDETPRAGTSARDVNYYDWFYCTRCAEPKLIRLKAKSNTYEPTRFNATPTAR